MTRYPDNIWIGMAEVRETEECDLLNGALGGYAIALAVADSAREYAQRVTCRLNAYGLEVVAVEDVERLNDRLMHGDVAPEVLAQVGTLEKSNGVKVDRIFTFENEDDASDGDQPAL